MASRTPEPPETLLRRRAVTSALRAHALARQAGWAQLEAEIAADRAARAAEVDALRSEVRDRLDALRRARMPSSPAAEHGPAPSAAPSPAAPHPVAARRPEASPDDLMALDGLTVLDRRRLLLLDITTFRDLAAADPAELTDLLGPDRPVAAWQAQALERAA